MLVVVCSACGRTVPVTLGILAQCAHCAPSPSVPATDANLRPHFDAMDVYDRLAESGPDDDDDDDSDTDTDSWVAGPD